MSGSTDHSGSAPKTVVHSSKMKDLQLRDNVLGPGSLVVTACGGQPLARPISRRAVLAHWERPFRLTSTELLIRCCPARDEYRSAPAPEAPVLLARVP
jgi:hypothetical protein